MGLHLFFGNLSFLIALLFNAAFADDQACSQKVTDVFTRYGYHNPEDKNKSQTQVILVPEVASEFELDQYFTKGFREEIDERGVKNYQFILKKNFCDPDLLVQLKDGTTQRLNPERLALLQVFEHSYPEYAEANLKNFAEGTAKLNNRLQQIGLARNSITANDVEKERLEEMKRLLPAVYEELSRVNPALREIAKKRFAAFREDGETWSWETPGDGLSKIAKRLKDSTVRANISGCYGTQWANPDPDSVKLSTCLNFYSITDIMKLLMDENKIPEALQDRLILENYTGGNFFTTRDVALEQINTFSINWGKERNVETFIRNTFQKFTSFNGGCLENSHCQEFNYPSWGVRWNAVNRRKYNSNVYFEFDLIKTSNAPFEVETIKETSENSPHWPLLRKLKPVDPDHPGLLLGYIIRAGFTATVLDEVPQVIPFLANVLGSKADRKGKLEVFAEGRYYGSTVYVDDPDSLDIEYGIRLRYQNLYIIGFKVTYSSELKHDDANFDEPGRRRSMTTSMLFVTIPIKDIDYQDDVRPEKSKPVEFKLTELQPFYRYFPEGRAYHFNFKEFEKKSSEEGLRVAAQWNRFTFDVSVFNTTGMETQFAPKPQNYQTLEAFIKYKPDVAPRLNLVFGAKADTAKSGHKQFGLGIELTPLKHTPAAKFANVSILGMIYPSSDYNAIARGDAVKAANPNIEEKRFAAIDVKAERAVNIPWVTENLGFQGKFGIYTSVFFNKDFDAGYFSISARAALKNTKFCVEAGFTPFNQDGNFSVGTDKRPDNGPGQGQLGPHSDRYMYALLDGICAYKRINSLISGSAISEHELSDLNSDDSKMPFEPKPKSLHPSFRTNDIPIAERDQERTLNWLAAIATAWYKGDVDSDQARENFKKVPTLVARLSEKVMKNGLYSLKTGYPLMAARRFEIVRQIYDPKVNFTELNAIGDPLGDKLQWILRFTLSLDPRWKEVIMAGAPKNFEAATYCSGVGFEMLGENKIASERFAMSRDNGLCRRNPGLLTTLGASRELGVARMNVAISDLVREFLDQGKKQLRQENRLEHSLEYFDLVVNTLDGEKGQEKKYTRDYYLVDGFQRFMGSQNMDPARIQEIKALNQKTYDEAQYCLGVVYEAKNKPEKASAHFARSGSYKAPGRITGFINNWINLNYCKAPEKK